MGFGGLMESSYWYGDRSASMMYGGSWSTRMRVY